MRKTLLLSSLISTLAFDCFYAQNSTGLVTYDVKFPSRNINNEGLAKQVMCAKL